MRFLIFLCTITIIYLTFFIVNNTIIDNKNCNSYSSEELLIECNDSCIHCGIKDVYEINELKSYKEFTVSESTGEKVCLTCGNKQIKHCPYCNSNKVHNDYIEVEEAAIEYCKDCNNEWYIK